MTKTLTTLFSFICYHPSTGIVWISDDYFESFFLPIGGKNDSKYSSEIQDIPGAAGAEG